MEKYFSSIGRLEYVFDNTQREYAFEAKSKAEYDKWSNNLRKRLYDILGIDKMITCDLSVKCLESETFDGYRRDKLCIQTEPDVWMPFYVLVPDTIDEKKKNRCIIAAHGHCVGGKDAVVGRTDIPAVVGANKEFYSDYGLSFVKKGFIVFCPDARGFGERREFMRQGENDILGHSCNWLNKVAISLGQSAMGMMVWDIMRLIDYVQSRDDCDSNRIACVGLSGGGMQTLWTAALDERIKCSVVSGYFYGFKEAHLLLDHCDCNYVPNLWRTADVGDIAALIALRPLLIETGIHDDLNGRRGIENVKEQVNITQKAYSLLGEENKLSHHVFDGKHRWDGATAYDFVDKWL
jgi:dienelactone hydrolase